MKSSIHRSLILAVLFLFVWGSASADIRIQLIKGKRAIKDKVTFTVEVSHEKNENPRYAAMPEFIQISGTFAGPASGAIALDGKGITRFDETKAFESERTEITYGRHVITVHLSSPAIATSLVVFVRGGVVSEVIDEEGTREGSKK
jgi:hypothetical protein